MYKLFIASALLLAVCLAPSPAMAGGEPSPPPTTTSDCNSGWNNSPASQTCTLNGRSVTDNKCNFWARCTYQTTTGDDAGTTYILGVSKGDASKIYHCQKLVLQVGSC